MTRHGTRLGASPELAGYIGERLRSEQKRVGLKNEEVARETGIGLRLVQKHRAGHNAPNWVNLNEYARLFDRDVRWFLPDSDRDAA